MELGLYIHFPWCRKLCPYCDFAVAVAGWDDTAAHARYAAALEEELAEQAPRFAGRRLVSIYVGGGTPSLWQPASLARVLDRAAAAFGADLAALEVTVEANPTDCVADRMAAWRDAGVTRLSIGVQSFDASELRVLGRDHRMGDGRAAAAAAQDAGFASLSLDVILGAPTAAARAATPERLAASAAEAAELGAPHLSVYELTIEERTRFGRAVAAGRMTPLDADLLADAYAAAHDVLTARGYEHYEVSSYARPGHRAVHNSLYWRGAEFLGLGCGAASFRLDDGGGGARWTNARRVADYLRPGDRVAAREMLSPADVARDRVWLGLRTADGVDESALDAMPALYAWLTRGGLAEPRDGRIRPTLRGFLFADEVARRVLVGAELLD